MALGEGLLHRVQVAFGQALDGGDVRAFELNGQDRAGLDRVAIDDHGAAAALARVATHMGAGQLAVVSQEFDQQGSGLHLMGLELSVDGDGGRGHGEALSVGVGRSRRGLTEPQSAGNPKSSSLGFAKRQGPSGQDLILRL